MLVESIPNFSEGRRVEVISKLAAAVRPRLLDSDPDPDHNRLVLSVGGEPGAVLDAVFAAIAVAVEGIDLRGHSGVHPRVGAADVVPLVPLGDIPLARCVELALELGERVWTSLQVPVFFYGAAAPQGARALREIRGASPPPPDLGSGRHPSAGAVSIGARPPLVAYNVLLPGVSLSVAKRIARSLRESSGGLSGVQALAFPVSLGSQVSMNLVALDKTSPGAALAAVNEVCRELGVRPGPDQVVGLCPVRYAVPAASGALLEARLAAAGARLGAVTARAAGGEEHLRLAAHLEAEADRLAALPFDGDSLLSGSEAAAALRRVLVAGQIATAESIELLDLAAGELRAAVPAETLGKYPERRAALDRWLAESG